MSNRSKQSLLWRITPKQGGRHSYLFGTMHVRDARAFRWLERARQHLLECDLFATEFDFIESDPEALAKALALPEGTDLHQLISPNAWKKLDRIAQKRGLGTADVFRHEHPMSVSTALSMLHMAAETPYSLDETLWQIARSNGIPTTGVESFSEQIDTLERIPLETHIKSLTWLIKNESSHKMRMKKMLRRYMDGDIQALYKAARKDAKGMRKTLLFRRNKIMTDRFMLLAQDNALFCAVGAGHLAGGKGMLRLLKKSGFKVVPMAYATT
jgi:uncharacterized protein YbaP (TraB family)